MNNSFVISVTLKYFKGNLSPANKAFLAKSQLRTLRSIDATPASSNFFIIHALSGSERGSRVERYKNMSLKFFFGSIGKSISGFPCSHLIIHPPREIIGNLCVFFPQRSNKKKCIADNQHRVTLFHCLAPNIYTISPFLIQTSQ